ncbi:MAG: TIGR04283 family arsenosugar biosynthesis glycosyltransferase [Burkholderiaceae bacterium]
MCPPNSIAVVIPALNEAGSIGVLVASVLEGAAICIVVDAGSSDGTAAIAKEAGATVITAPRGRAKQMNAGAARALEGSAPVDALLFLHADIALPAQWPTALQACPTHRWSRFDVELTSEKLMGWRLGLLHLIGWFMNERSALTGICTGDQGLLVPVDLWRRIEGFADIPLMEDIEISSRLKKAAGTPYRIEARLKVSPRRWEEQGVFRTMLLMWSYRLRWFFGASAQSLHARYYRSSQG